MDDLIQLERHKCTSKSLEQSKSCVSQIITYLCYGKSKVKNEVDGRMTILGRPGNLIWLHTAPETVCGTPEIGGALGAMDIHSNLVWVIYN